MKGVQIDPPPPEKTIFNMREHCSSSNLFIL